MKKAVLYCYHGERYEEEAIASIRSLRKHSDNVNINVIAPCRPNLDGVEFTSHPTSPSYSGFGYKVNAIGNFKGSRFVFLDTDTNIVSDISELFSLWEFCGIAGVVDPLWDTFLHVPNLVRPSNWRTDLAQIPEINTGVLVINHEKLPIHFMEAWLFRHDELRKANPNLESSKIPDQPSLRQTLIDFKIAPLLLGAEFNFRPCYPQVLYRSSKIVHIHKSARTAHYNGAGVDGDIVSTFPWGGSIRRSSHLNRALFRFRRLVNF